jgi:hypothetical protein
MTDMSIVAAPVVVESYDFSASSDFLRKFRAALTLIL